MVRTQAPHRNFISGDVSERLRVVTAVVKVWRERLGDAAADCNAQRYNQAEASLISLAEEILTNPEISSRLRKNADGPTSPSSNEVVGRRALGVAAASLAGRACFLYMEARYADAHEMLNQVRLATCDLLLATFQESARLNLLALIRKLLLHQVLVLEPTNPLWLCQRANVKFDMGKVKLAQADLEAALVLDRRCAAAYLQKGHIELFHGDKTKATPELRYSLAIDDELPLAHVELALALQSGGKGDQALYVLEKAAARFPASVELRCFYAEMVGAGGDLIEAMAQFREVVAMAPQCPLPYLHTALLLASLGDVPSALAHLDAACELCAEGTASESFDAGHVELGTMLMSRDDKEGAAHHFDVAFRSARSLPVRIFASYTSHAVPKEIILGSDCLTEHCAGVGGSCDGEAAGCCAAISVRAAEAADQSSGGEAASDAVRNTDDADAAGGAVGVVMECMHGWKRVCVC